MKGKRFSSSFMQALRNEIAIGDLVISILKLPAKYSEGFLRFLCPLCGEFHTAVSRKTNLARCFRCRINFNPIEMVMAAKNCPFIEAVRFLEPLLSSPRQNPA